MIDFGIIAAGDGKRIKEDGISIPKPLVKIAGQPMIGRLIKLMENVGARSVNVIINKDMPDVGEYLQSFVPQLNCPLRFLSTQTPSSMHSFYELLQFMNPEDRYVVTTVDTVFEETEFRRYVEYFTNLDDRLDGVMGVTRFIDDESPLYVKTDTNNFITAFEDGSDQQNCFVSAGIYGLCRTSLPVLEQCVETGIKRMRNFQRNLLKVGLNLKAFDMGTVIDIDHLSDIEKANAFLV